jgi:hypothetical protein
MLDSSPLYSSRAAAIGIWCRLGLIPTLPGATNHARDAPATARGTTPTQPDQRHVARPATIRAA